MFSVQQGLKDTGAARRSTYSKPTEPIIDMIEAEPSFGYRTVVALLGMNRAADLPAQGLAGAEAPAWSASANRSEDFSRPGAGSVMGCGSVPALGWQGRPAQHGVSDRLRHATFAGMALVVNRYGEHRIGDLPRAKIGGSLQKIFELVLWGTSWETAAIKNNVSVKFQEAKLLRGEDSTTMRSIQFQTKTNLYVRW